MAEKAQPAFKVSDFSLCHDTPSTTKSRGEGYIGSTPSFRPAGMSDL